MAGLVGHDARGSFFQSLDWLRVYWRHFGAGQQLRVLVVTSCGEPMGIVPLVVRRETTRVGEVRVLTYPLDDWGTYFGPIGSRRRTILRARAEAPGAGAARLGRARTAFG